jgi:nucleoside-diphosphate-sugar epimerase
MRIVVTGGSSFVGAWFCARAALRHEVFALTHTSALQLNGVTPVKVDLRRERDVARVRALRPDVVVHLAAKIRGAGPQPGEAAAALNAAMMDAVLGVGAPVLYASSPVARWAMETPYGRQRKEDEARLAASGLPFAVLRPSAPYGPRLATHTPRHAESFHTLGALAMGAPVVPVPGTGRQRRQPIHVADFADAGLALIAAGLRGQAFDAGGAEALSMREIVRAIARAGGRRVGPLVVGVPAAVLGVVGGWTGAFEPSLVRAGVEDELADGAALAAATGVRLRGFTEGAGEVLR